MFFCKECDSPTRQQAHIAIENGIIRRFYQCRNLYCGLCFSTIETVQLSSDLNDKKRLTEVIRRATDE
ncbi:hypothetical protein OKT76_04535 [Providencia rettgeri]|uniref:hypothetical protein n=1 Tax=Providencia rettgeri TaxID=587 RepID=UPI00226E9BDF|nr:hypothetical protein [Providencia rettgeri]MCX9094996.1 hypothetical protein [Providencia rettgeri]